MNNKNKKNNSLSSISNPREFGVGEIRYKPSLLWSSALLWAITGTVGFGVIFSFIARIDEVIIAKGELQANGAERPIKAPFESIVKTINVKEGERVEIGQLLIELDTESYKAQNEVLKVQLDSLYSNKNFQADIVNRLNHLNSNGAISLIDFLKEKNSLKEIEYQIKQKEAQIEGIKSEVSKTRLVSPTNGRVFNLIPSNKGYFTKSGETLLVIVPEGVLEAKVFLKNKDIGFIKQNMKAEIRVEAYPFTQFGSITGKLKFIGKEVLPADQQNPQSRFPAIVKLDKQHFQLKGEKYNLKSGQNVSVNLIIRDKPVITLLTNSIEKAFDSLRGIKSPIK